MAELKFEDVFNARSHLVSDISEMKVTAFYIRESSTSRQKFDFQWKDIYQWVETNKA
jgi:hypothetical protein